MPPDHNARRARLSLTSLIDVIFLLLLFFMLSSTFSKFAEVELSLGGIGALPSTDTREAHFLRLADGEVSLNGQPIETEAIADRLKTAERPGTALISVTESARAQLLTDVLVALRGVPDLAITVLGSR